VQRNKKSRYPAYNSTFTSTKNFCGYNAGFNFFTGNQWTVTLHTKVKSVYASVTMATAKHRTFVRHTGVNLSKYDTFSSHCRKLKTGYTTHTETIT